MNKPEQHPVRLVGSLASSSIYDEAFLSCSDGYCVFDANNILTAFSNTFPSLYPNVEKDICLGLSYEEYMRLFVQKRAIRNLGVIKDTEEWVKHQVDSQAADLSFLHHLHNGRWIEIKQHRVTTGETLFVAFDVSDLMLQQQKLTASQNKFRTFATLASDWFWELDRNLHYVYHSNHRRPLPHLDSSGAIIEQTQDKVPEMAEHLTGISRIDAMSNSMLHDDEFRKHNEYLRQHKQVDVVLTWLDSYGRKTFSHVRAEPQFDEDGHFSGYIGCGRDVSDHMMLAEQLERNANYDYLTGALNKRAFEAALEFQLTHLANSGESMTLCLVDLDRFKAVNDESGHAAGDEVLKKLGAILRRSLGENATIGRIGGDEFGLLISGGGSSVRRKLGDLIDTIASMHFDGRAKSHTIGASIGATEVDIGLSAKELLNQADQACYRAKDAGKGCVRFYDDAELVDNSPTNRLASVTDSPHTIELSPLLPSNHRPLVAILTDQSTNYQNRLSSVIGEELAAAGVASVNLMLQNQKDTGRIERDDSQTPALSTDLDSYSIDGIIALTGAIGINLLPATLERIIEEMDDIPIVSLGSGLSKCESVLYEEPSSVFELLEKVVECHENPVVSFIRGHPDNPDSRRRESICREFLAKRNLSVDEALFVTGNYLESDTYTAVSGYLQQGLRPDIIVAANTRMAMSASQAFHDHGVDVRSDVWVVSFDVLGGIDSLDPIIASLSTPILKVASQTAQRMISRLSSGGSDHGTEVEGFEPENNMVIGSVHDSHFTAPHTKLTDYFVNTRWILGQPEFDRLLPVDVSQETVLAHFDSELNGNGSDFSQVLKRPDFPAAEDFYDLNTLSLLLDCLLTGFTEIERDGRSSESSENLKCECEGLRKKLVSSRNRFEFQRLKNRQILERMGRQLLAVRTIDEVCGVLDAGLIESGFTRAFLILSETGELSNGTNRVVYALSSDDVSHAIGEAVAEGCFLPKALRYHLLTGQLRRLPVMHAEVESGYLLIGTEDVDPTGITNLGEYLSSSISNCFQNRENEKKTLELREINNELARQSNHDPITGLPNYDQFEIQLDKMITERDRRVYQTALVKINLEDFQQFAISCGVSNTGYVLRTVASRLGEFRSNKVQLARVGESEFAVIARFGREDQSTEELVTAMLDKLGEPCEIGGRSLSLRVSAGIAYYPDHGNDGDILVANADAAARYAATTGQNEYATFSASLKNSVLDKWQLDQDMRRGLTNDEFYLVYQPKISMVSGLIESFEALLRWNPSRKNGAHDSPIGPNLFVPVAEETGFITELSDFVIEAACKQLADWRVAGLETRVSVNLSTLDISSPNLIDRVTGPLSHYELPSKALEVEVTETAAMGDIESSIAKLEELRALGLEIAIDDFGTHYSSLNYLKRLPATYLKIDQSFVRDIEQQHDSADVAIVKAIIALAHSLGFKVVAEGVENEQQYQCLESLNCDLIQGYLFSPPVPADEATYLLVTRNSDGEKAA